MEQEYANVAGTIAEDDCVFAEYKQDPKLQEAKAKRRIYSIGHSSHTIDEFLSILLQHKITSLVDVRGSPRSIRNFQFNAEALEKACKKVGVSYRHCPELGNRKTPIEKLINTEEGIAAVKQLAAEYRNSDENATAIMCSEHASRSCHRKIVSQRLYDDFDVNVTHIRFDGAVFKHEKGTTSQLTDEAYLTTVIEPVNTWHEKC